MSESLRITSTVSFADPQSTSGLHSTHLVAVDYVQYLRNS